MHITNYMPCILITYFKYLYFSYLTTLQTNSQNNLGSSHALPAAHAVWLNTQNCAWFGKQISVIIAPPRILHQGSAPGPRSVPETPCAPASKTWLCHSSADIYATSWSKEFIRKRMPKMQFWAAAKAVLDITACRLIHDPEQYTVSQKLDFLRVHFQHTCYDSRTYQTNL